jgi:N-sulfoglucosamine sulfohydrolase
MNRRNFLRNIAIGTAGLLISQQLLAADKRKQPNFLIYISDDHSLRDSSAYGAKDIQTPFMDQLAREGILFNSAFIASPTCAPSRAALLTGLMPSRNGAEANHTYPRKDIKKLPAYLQELGYEVAAFGKVAHGKSNNTIGFDYFNNEKDVISLKKNVKAYLNKRVSTKPLCLFVGTGNPHVPWPEQSTYDPKELILPPTHVDTPDTRHYRARYYQEVKDMDGLLGELRKIVDKHLGKNTMIANTSDHGAQWPFGNWNLYDAGIRTPFIASWPGMIKPNTKTKAIVSWIDILPTLVELGGGEITQNIDGRSFADVLKNGNQEHRNFIFTTHSGDHDKNVYPIRSVRTEEWKYILNLNPEYAYTTHIDLVLSDQSCAYWTDWIERAKTDKNARTIVDRYHKRPKEELYHLPSDPYEQKNLVFNSKHSEILKNLRSELQKWMNEQDDSRKTFNEPYYLSQPKSWKPGKFMKRKPEK